MATKGDVASFLGDCACRSRISPFSHSSFLKNQVFSQRLFCSSLAGPGCFGLVLLVKTTRDSEVNHEHSRPGELTGSPFVNLRGFFLFDVNLISLTLAGSRIPSTRRVIPVVVFSTRQLEWPVRAVCAWLQKTLKYHCGSKRTRDDRASVTTRGDICEDLYSLCRGCWNVEK
jgi:hypothetical protein